MSLFAGHGMWSSRNTYHQKDYCPGISSALRHLTHRPDSDGLSLHVLRHSTLSPTATATRPDGRTGNRKESFHPCCFRRVARLAPRCIEKIRSMLRARTCRRLLWLAADTSRFRVLRHAETLGRGWQDSFTSLDMYMAGLGMHGARFAKRDGISHVRGRLF